MKYRNGSGFGKLILLSLTILLGSLVRFSSHGQGIDAQEISIPFIEQSFARVGDVVKLDWSPDSSTVAIALGTDLLLYTNDLVELARWQGHTDAITEVDWKPDGRFIATSSLDGTVRIWDALSSSPSYGSVVYILPHNNSVHNVRWSPNINDQRLASQEFISLEYYSDAVLELSNIHIWDLSSQTISLTLPVIPGQYNLTNLTWSPGGEYVGYSAYEDSGDYVISLWDPDNGGLIQNNPSSLGFIYEITWHPDGNNLAFVEEANNIVRELVNTDGSLTFIDSFQAPSAAAALGVSWSFDGQLIAMGNEKNQIYVWAPQANQAWQLAVSHAAEVTQVAWSPDNTRLASLSRDDVIRIWYFNDEEFRDSALENSSTACDTATPAADTAASTNTNSAGSQQTPCDP